MKIKEFSNRSRERTEQYVELARDIARRFGSSVLSFEEREEAALVGIARGLDSFKENSLAESSWLFLKGYYAVRDAIRIEKRNRRKTISAYKLFDAPQAIYDECESAEQERDDLVLRSSSYALNCLCRLDWRTRKIIKEIIFNGARQVDVARSLGISQSWCSRLYNRGLQTLRARLSIVEQGASAKRVSRTI